MKKAKLVSAILTSAMLLSMTACSSQKDATETTADTSKAEETTEGMEPEESETTEAEETEPEEAEDTSESTKEETEPSKTSEKAGDLFEFTQDNFPVLDGSTSTKPMAVAIASVLLGMSTEEADAFLTFHKTTDSFSYFKYGDADMLIVAQPSAEALESISDVDYIMEPFASEALVFVVNKDNPIDSLTTEQIQKIYTGEITNWKEVGGEDLEIVPIQRNHEAGSQVMMEKLVMGDIEMMEPPVDYQVGTMEALTTAVKSYDASSEAIGYTVYYYAKNMKYADGLKILKVNDVEPNPDSIRNKEYPFINPYFLVLRNGLEENDPTKILFDWLMSEEGQKLVDKQGYVAVGAN